MSCRQFIASACLVLVAVPANAGILTFNPATITPGMGGPANPVVVLGNASVSYASDGKNNPILPNGLPTPGNDGYEIKNFTYYVTAAANPTTGKVNSVTVAWLTQENFSSTVVSNITVSIMGNMTISESGGSMVGSVRGLIDGNLNPTVQFDYPPPPAGAQAITGPVNNVNVPWNDNNVKNNVPMNDSHTLNMITSITWLPSAVGDVLTINGSYTITANVAGAAPVPEPSSFVMGAIGAITAGFFGLFRSRIGRCTASRIG